MHIISKRPLREFWDRYPDARAPLEDWWKITTHAVWKNPAETKSDFSHADLIGSCTIFNIGGNKYRLVAKINYRSKVIYIRNVMTHTEYDKETWKRDCK